MKRRKRRSTLVVFIPIANEERMRAMNRKLTRLIERMEKVMAALDDLQANVQKNNDVEQSAVTLIQGLKTQLDQAIATNDMAKVQDLSNQLGSQTDALAAAVTANTPAPSPAPAPGQPTA